MIYQKQKLQGFVMDMIGHNRDNDRDIFQISPGKSLQSSQTCISCSYCKYDYGTKTFMNGIKQQKENDCKRQGFRSADGLQIPRLAKYLPFIGEVRTQFDPAQFTLQYRWTDFF